MRLSKTSVVCLAAASLAAQAHAQTADSDKAESLPAPAADRFDPGAMPQAGVQEPELGYRYANLSTRQTRALRRGFKLPLDALIAARSTKDLIGSAVVAPLPDPNRPILAAGQAEDASDPFGGKPKLTSFRDDPMRALGERLGVAAGDSMEEIADAATPDSIDPFGAMADEPTTPVAADDNAGASDPGDDPFGDDPADDPFGGDASDDPFADF